MAIFHAPNALALGGKPTEKRLFLDAIEGRIPEPLERNLLEATRGDHSLTRKVLGLVQAHQSRDREIGSVLPRSVKTLVETTKGKVTQWIGTIFDGKYLAFEQTGQGGCGLVFKAQQVQPMFRQVALKIAKDSHQTRQLETVLDREAKILSQLDHPHIVRLLDKGKHNESSNFLVMEWVDGTPLREHCKKTNLDFQETIDLFFQLCEAVHHCHAKGILHLDLKPDNVLVYQVDGKAHIKLIDFGAAMTVDQIQRRSGLFPTLHMFGSTDYMSDEQASCRLTDLDPRSDLYALGKILEDLLADLGERSRTETGKDTRFQPRGTTGQWISLVHKATREHKEDRFESVAAFEEEMKDLITKRNRLNFKNILFSIYIILIFIIFISPIFAAIFLS